MTNQGALVRRLCRLAGIIVILLGASSWRRDDPPPVPTVRFALLIGVDDYRPDDYISTKAGPEMLEDLATPCSDARRIAARLELAGWRGEFDANPEVKVLCDPGAGVMAAEIATMTRMLTEHEGALGVMYLAGHGVGINGRSYFFGTRATVDLPAAGARLRRDPNATLFGGSAIELRFDIVQRIGATCECDLLVIVDSCRNDPLAQMPTEQELGRPINTASAVDVQAQGLYFLFANSEGAKVRELQTTYIADAIAQELKPRTNLARFVADIAKRVRSKSRYDSPPQQPDGKGVMLNPDICLTLCSEPTSGPVRHNLLLKRHLPHLMSSRVPRQPEQDVSVTIYEPADDLAARNAGALSVDFYWCAGAGGDARALKAMSAAIGFSELGRGGTSRGGVPLGQVRVRRLSEEGNDKAAFRLNENVVRADSKLATQTAWAEEVRRVTERAVAVSRGREISGDVLNVYFCEGASPPPEAPLLYIQVARDDQLWIASSVGDRLRAAASDVNVIGRVEVRPGQSPNDSQIRYVHDEDEITAARLAAIAAATGDIKLKVVHMSQYQDRVPRGRMELWIGENVDTVPPAVVTGQ